MRVLVADKFEKSGLDGLRALGCEVLYEPDLADEALVARMASSGPQVVVVRSTKVTAAMMSPALKLVIRAGAGVNTIDVKAATAAGVWTARHSDAAGRHRRTWLRPAGPAGGASPVQIRVRLLRGRTRDAEAARELPGS